MYGNYNIPVKFGREGLTLTIEKTGPQTCQYTRICGTEQVEKTLIVSREDILLHPVEPLNMPKALTPHLLIEFAKPLFIEPRATKSLFLTFPIEIGVFVRISKKNFQVIDLFSFAPKKFTLYGDPKNGVICKYWKSDLYDTLPTLDAMHQGVIELTLDNGDNECQQVTKTILNAYGMAIFYRSNLVGMKAAMHVKDGGTAITDCRNSPFEQGMKRAIETYTVPKLSMTTTTFTMEYGL